MEIGEKKLSQGYGEPPWIFKGRALYQIHLVRSETARALIPKEFRLVEAFGYTLGGFFLASYEDSPAGVFDELVVIAGTLWNPPTSCAWAAKVLVNSKAACQHGRKAVGLPSQVARFSKRLTPAPQRSPKNENRFQSILGISASSPTDQMEVCVSEINDLEATDPCHINLTTLVPAETEKANSWRGPPLKMSLPSFSGRTDYNPNLLKYSCQIHCRIRAVSPLKVTKLGSRLVDLTREQEDSEKGSSISTKSGTRDSIEKERNLSLSVMLSKPILALEFSCLRMQVEAPVVISHCTKSPSTPRHA